MLKAIACVHRCRCRCLRCRCLKMLEHCQQAGKQPTLHACVRMRVPPQLSSGFDRTKRLGELTVERCTARVRACMCSGFSITLCPTHSDACCAVFRVVFSRNCLCWCGAVPPLVRRSPTQFSLQLNNSVSIHAFSGRSPALPCPALPLSVRRPSACSVKEGRKESVEGGVAAVQW